ncbi:MAG: hypothetical protein NTX61_13145 [Bacteroidetes bacterium]|nr:hypothetical protein [Bacteroidota bacterium]
MNVLLNHYKFILLFLLLFETEFINAQAKLDSFDIVSKSMFFPHIYKPAEVRFSAGFSMVRLPYDWVETAIEAPVVDLRMNLGLPAGFSILGDINTLIVSNQFMVGPRWNMRHHNFSMNIAYDVAFVYGYMTILGFDNTVKAWVHYPNLSLGYSVNDLLFTLKIEIPVLTKFSVRAGGNEIIRTKDMIDGLTVGIYVEQRLWKKMGFVTGIKDNYLKFYWPAWPVFTTFSRRYHIPELYFSWLL